MTVPHYVKTSLAPGSRVVTDYFNKAGLTEYLDKLGFQTTGYGCMTCIGNSGPLPESIANAVEKKDLVVAAVLSGNRNFEGRINPHVKANYLASPPLVVAYALAGNIDIDFTTQPIGTARIMPALGSCFRLPASGFHPSLPSYPSPGPRSWTRCSAGSASSAILAGRSSSAHPERDS